MASRRVHSRGTKAADWNLDCVVVETACGSWMAEDCLVSGICGYTETAPGQTCEQGRVCPQA